MKKQAKATKPVTKQQTRKQKQKSEQRNETIQERVRKAVESHTWIVEVMEQHHKEILSALWEGRAA